MVLRKKNFYVQTDYESFLKKESKFVREALKKNLADFCEFDANRDITEDASKVFYTYHTKILDHKRRIISINFSEIYSKTKSGDIKVLKESRVDMEYEQGIDEEDLEIVRKAITESGLEKI
jgi:hypothetical protein